LLALEIDILLGSTNNYIKEIDPHIDDPAGKFEEPEPFELYSRGVDLHQITSNLYKIDYV
jgi:hypothetical protein